MTEFVGLRAETYSYLIDDSRKDKKVKGDDDERIQSIDSIEA